MVMSFMIRVSGMLFVIMLVVISMFFMIVFIMVMFSMFFMLFVVMITMLSMFLMIVFIVIMLGMFFMLFMVVIIMLGMLFMIAVIVIMRVETGTLAEGQQVDTLGLKQFDFNCVGSHGFDRLGKGRRQGRAHPEHDICALDEGGLGWLQGKTMW